MNENIFYKYSDFMEEEFPFKIEIKGRNNLNGILHAHDNFQICYVSKGMCLHSVGSRTSTLTKGDVFSIPPYETHKLHSLEEKEVEIIQIDFTTFFINENMREITSMESFNDFLYIQPLMSKDRETIPKLNISSQNSAHIEKLIDSMYREFKEKEEGFKLSIKADLLKLLVIIGREFKRYVLEDEENRSAAQYKEKFKEVIRFIEENYNKDIKLEEVALKSNMSPAYFSHLFKIITQNSVVDFINQTRINKAMEFLKTTNLNVTEICFLVGFNNLGHFNKMFKRISGATPSQFKKANSK